MVEKCPHNGVIFRSRVPKKHHKLVKIEKNQHLKGHQAYLMNETCTISLLDFFTSLLAVLLQTPSTFPNCGLVGSYPKDSSFQVYKQQHPVYDFIVVGSGSAGCVIANRLSEISKWTVLLIEAGPDPPINSDIPTLHNTLTESRYDWNYSMEPSNDSCLSYNNHQGKQPRGKILGGCSSINYCYCIRGNPKDYDNWESMGNPGWAYKDVLKYFKKLERLEIPKESNEYAVHGYDGNVYVEQFTNRTLYDSVQVKNYVANYSIALGYDINEDIIANHRTGITLAPSTSHNDVRWSVAKAYLQPARHRPNLIVMKETLATKILINSQKQAYGVEVHKKGKYKKIYARKEVIVSAGSINSPQLLMLSGIGPKDHLLDHGIKSIQDLNVGNNLQDHLVIFGISALVNFDSFKKLYPMPIFLYEYLSHRIDLGVVSDPMIFFNTTGYDMSYPNIQTYNIIYPQNDKSLLQLVKKFNLKPEIINQYAQLSKQSPQIVILPTLLKPKSKGHILLKSADPFEHVKIYSGYLTMKEDIEALTEALKIIQKLSQAEAFRKHGNLTFLSVNDCSRYPSHSNKYYECFLRHFGTSVYHPAGTCKMAPREDADAVVNFELKVYGIRNLRVADSSIMPDVVTGNLNIPTIMIGEKASDMIKKDWL